MLRRCIPPGICRYLYTPRGTTLTRTRMAYTPGGIYPPGVSFFACTGLAGLPRGDCPNSGESAVLGPL